LLELKEIRNFDQCDLVRLVQEELELIDESQYKQILNHGNILLLLDGLDEVSEHLRQTVQNNIQWFCKTYFKSYVVLTCRTQTVEHILESFDCIEVADFTSEQIEQFAQNWFMALAKSPEDGTVQAKDFISKLMKPEHRQTAELAITPMLLSLVCWVYQDQEDFPQERSDLYRRGVELLLGKWDRNRNIQRKFSSSVYENLSITSKQDLLGYIAISKFQHDQFVLFTQQEIQQYIAEYLTISNEEGQAVLKDIEAHCGLLVERAFEVYSFSHLTFQEYFAARQISSQNNESAFQSLVLNITKKHWQFIFLMVANISADVEHLIWLMKHRIDDLIRGDEQLRQFLVWVKNKAISASNGRYKISATRAFYFYFERIFPNCIGELLSPNRELLPYIIDSNFHRDMVCGYNYGSALEIIRSIPTSSLNFSFFLALPNEIALDIALALILDNDIVFRYALQALLPILNLELSPRLRNKLQMLIEMIPVDWDDWNKEDALTWQEKFHNLIANERNIGHDWKFTAHQKKVLQQYYDANKLLIDCLKLSKISSESRRSIENSLFLPLPSNKSAEK